MQGLQPSLPRPHQVLRGIIYEQGLCGVQLLFCEYFLIRFHIGFPHAQGMGIIGFDEIAVKVGTVVLPGKDLRESVVMDAVGIGEQVDPVFVPDLVQPVQPLLRKIEHQSVPGLPDLIIGQSKAGFLAKCVVEFLVADLAGFQLLEQVVGMVLVEHAGECRNAKVDECPFGQTKVEVHKNPAKVEYDVFGQFENLRMRKFENADLPWSNGIQLPICRQVMA